MTKQIMFNFLSEIQRVPLEKLCLRIKILGLFFGQDIKVCYREVMHLGALA